MSKQYPASISERPRRAFPSGESDLLVFSHLQKAAGTTFTSLLRRHFGLRHLDVHPVRGWLYRREQLEADLRTSPFHHVVSIAGHWCRPFIDYGEFDHRMIWYTFLRHPVDRYISHYQHHIEKLGRKLSFEEYLADPILRNWQVQFLAGRQDVELAKRLLSEKFRFVGLSERFDESLLLFRHRLGLSDFNVLYGERKNPERSGAARQKIQSDFERWERAILENNALDMELYEHVRNSVYPRQVADYGAERLASDLEAPPGRSAPVSEYLREREVDFVRWCVYRPLLTMRRQRARWQWMKDERY